MGSGGSGELPGSAGGAGGSGSAMQDTFTWPTAPGWSKETMAFPLDFAPDLPYQGLEELRFAPQFFEPGAPGYWSYAFAWWLENSAPLDEVALTEGLTQYFRGLCDAVGGTEFSFEPSHFQTTLMRALRSSDGSSGTSYRGLIDTYDPFTTGEALTLQIRAQVFACGEHQVVLIGASPKLDTEPIWTDLSEVLGSFQCH